MVHVKALQDRCVAQEDIVTRVRKHNTNLMDQQGQYKEALRLLHIELKEMKEKLEAADRQKETLQEELTASRERMEKAGADAV